MKLTRDPIQVWGLFACSAASAFPSTLSTTESPRSVPNITKSFNDDLHSLSVKQRIFLTHYQITCVIKRGNRNNNSRRSPGVWSVLPSRTSQFPGWQWCSTVLRLCCGVGWRLCRRHQFAELFKVLTWFVIVWLTQSIDVEGLDTEGKRNLLLFFQLFLGFVQVLTSRFDVGELRLIRGKIGRLDDHCKSQSSPQLSNEFFCSANPTPSKASNGTANRIVDERGDDRLKRQQSVNTSVKGGGSWSRPRNLPSALNQNRQNDCPRKWQHVGHKLELVVDVIVNVVLDRKNRPASPCPLRLRGRHPPPFCPPGSWAERGIFPVRNIKPRKITRWGAGE